MRTVPGKKQTGLTLPRLLGLWFLVWFPLLYLLLPGDGRANYTDLDPGSETFTIKGSNKDGVRSEEKSLKIDIPLLPRQSQAVALYGLTLGFLVALYLRAQHRKLAQRQHLLVP